MGTTAQGTDTSHRPLASPSNAHGSVPAEATTSPATTARTTTGSRRQSDSAASMGARLMPDTSVAPSQRFHCHWSRGGGAPS